MYEHRQHWNSENSNSNRSKNKTQIRNRKVKLIAVIWLFFQPHYSTYNVKLYATTAYIPFCETYTRQLKNATSMFLLIFFHAMVSVFFSFNFSSWFVPTVVFIRCCCCSPLHNIGFCSLKLIPLRETRESHARFFTVATGPMVMTMKRKSMK